MASLKSGAEVAAAPKEYDPEIVDMAKYIHNYNIDSDVAVRSILSHLLYLGEIGLNYVHSMTLLAGSSSIRLAVVSRL